MESSPRASGGLFYHQTSSTEAFIGTPIPYRSTIALPLRRHGKVAAVLSIYAAEPQAFDTEEVKLLSALADDISHALSSM